MSKKIKMKTDCDCMVACLAMLMRWTYDECASYFPPKAIKETGYRFEWLTPYLGACKVYLIWYGEPLLSSVDWAKPAIVDVPSLTLPEKGDHIIFWDGKKVIDPSRKKLKYTKLPKVIYTVYQRKTYP